MHKLSGWILVLAWGWWAFLPAHAQESRVPKLLIIGPQQWQADLEDYVQQRRGQVEGCWASWEQLVSETTGADEPEKIKRFLYDQWRSHKLDHVLLVGDATCTPVRYMVLDRITPAAHDYAFYPSDLYFADLAKEDGSFESWNGSQAGIHGQYFGEVRGERHKADPINFDDIDYRPEIGVGRWPVRTRKELQNVIEKSLAYERQILDQAHPAARRAALLAVSGWIDSRPQLDDMARELKDWQLEKRYFADTGRNDGTEPPDARQVEQLLRDGASLIFHAGHGDPEGWHQCIHWPQLKEISNRDRLPVILSAGCDTAVFAPLGPYQAYCDIHGQAHQGTNSGETFPEPPPPPAAIQPERFATTSWGTRLIVSRPDGAIAYFGCSTGAQPCALSLLHGFARAVGSRTSAPVRLGTAYRGMIDYYVEAEKLAELKPNADWYPPSIFFQGMKFVLFGDPSLPIAE